jgi:hypothetical protein
MFCVFVDECGYVQNWSDPREVQQQPVYVVAAVAISSESLADLYTSIRNAVASLMLPETDPGKLGRGEEIKAASVDRGEGFWGKNPGLRDAVRKVYLDLPNVTYFVICIDKKRHRKLYGVNAEDPSDLGLRLLLERIQGFLRDHEKFGIVFIDANKRKEPRQRSFLGNLLRFGSGGIAPSKFFIGAIYEWHLDMSNILEVHLGDSKHSLGLQIADFVARHAYSWWKDNKNPNYPGWNLIEPKLYKYPRHLGWGLKEFPS